jgi:enhancing lycopene biosynthesis protein 2
MTNPKKIAVVLSGCGVFDGSEIHESVFALWAIASAGATYDVYAPDMQQHHVINHLNGQEMSEKRNVLVEAARITRGVIQPLSELDTAKADALLFPGGFGVAKNLCSFAVDGVDCVVNPEVKKVVKEFHQAAKPIGAMCISPVLITKILGNPEVTIGSHKDTAKAIEAMGGKHVVATHGEVIVDASNKLVTTPCYMLDASILQIADGAKNLVAALMKML